jgi:two-component system chemotaxis sensor kinase CheA
MTPTTPILQQFLSESRDCLHDIGEKLMQLENTPGDAALMGELFRLVHTLKGNSGLFDFPEMSRVLHAAEDLMTVAREGEIVFSQTIADCLLDAMDFVGLLQDEIEATGRTDASHATASARLAEGLRQLITHSARAIVTVDVDLSSIAIDVSPGLALSLTDVPEGIRMAWYRLGSKASPLLWIAYRPEADCFFKGEDPFFQAIQVPDVAWCRVSAREPWLALDELDAYRCMLDFRMISTAPRPEIEEHFRYVAEQVMITAIAPCMLALPVGEDDGGSAHEIFVEEALTNLNKADFASLERTVRAALQLSAAGLRTSSALRWLLLLIECEPHNHVAMRALIESLASDGVQVRHSASSAVEFQMPSTASEPGIIRIPDDGIAAAVIGAQMAALAQADQAPGLTGRLKAIASTLRACFLATGRDALSPALDAVLAAAIEQGSAAPLRNWLGDLPSNDIAAPEAEPTRTAAESVPIPPAIGDVDQKSGRRAGDALAGPKTLKVDQEKIDRLMNLIGEMIVAKNGLPYLAGRADAVFNVRELAREIKALYAVINRIAEEMQDAIMQIRMLPVSFVFQRFPRLVRDISRKLGKEVSLVLEGEQTEADKNIIEALADPLIHIVRNSLDHGIERPEVRLAAGKPALGRLVIRASQEADRVVIDISDDGKGIDPAVIKRKAYEKGIIDEALLERIGDQDAVNLVFAAGFSTADVVSDLSGRGVGMDVVRAAVERVHGSVKLESVVGKGTSLRLSLPLSMAITNVMIVESNKQIFGVPMDLVVETVRVPLSAIRTIKSHQTTVLRDRIVPLRSLNELLATDSPQLPNAEDELATLVIRMQNEQIGIVVDDFREVVDIILKPMAGILGGLPGYAGSALLGDGSVLMVLNPKELV